MSIGGAGLSYDLNARSDRADLLQAQYFQNVLAAEQDELAADLAAHTARFGHPELPHDAARMQYERRAARALKEEVGEVPAGVLGVHTRFAVLAGRNPGGRDLRVPAGEPPLTRGDHQVLADHSPANSLRPPTPIVNTSSA